MQLICHKTIIAMCLALLSCSLLAMPACGDKQPIAKANDPATETATSVGIPLGWTVDQSYFGAAVASLAERIYASDVVVRATLFSAADGQITFNALEYLKGTGPSRFTIGANTAGRNAAWDNQEAVLFLDTPPSALQETAVRAGQQGAPTAHPPFPLRIPLPGPQSIWAQTSTTTGAICLWGIPLTPVTRYGCRQ